MIVADAYMKKMFVDHGESILSERPKLYILLCLVDTAVSVLLLLQLLLSLLENIKVWHFYYNLFLYL